MGPILWYAAVYHEGYMVEKVAIRTIKHVRILRFALVAAAAFVIALIVPRTDSPLNPSVHENGSDSIAYADIPAYSEGSYGGGGDGGGYSQGSYGGKDGGGGSGSDAGGGGDGCCGCGCDNDGGDDCI